LTYWPAAGTVRSIQHAVSSLEAFLFGCGDDCILHFLEITVLLHQLDNWTTGQRADKISEMEYDEVKWLRPVAGFTLLERDVNTDTVGIVDSIDSILLD
jgi:hypothetical protein